MNLSSARQEPRPTTLTFDFRDRRDALSYSFCGKEISAFFRGWNHLIRPADTFPARRRRGAHGVTHPTLLVDVNHFRRREAVEIC